MRVRERESAGERDSVWREGECASERVRVKECE